MKSSDAGRFVLPGVGGAVLLALTVVGYSFARRRLKNGERADRTPHRVLLEDSKRKAAGGATKPRSSLRSLPERSFSRR
ncbi:MAG TPA: hypothetical protein VLQ45_27620 [Thermoanaerobaculia bacterium]|nr:hypothetical protein [Thermoanaerobaculia bacterium]